MKKSSNNDGTAKTAKAIAAETNNISYVVKLEILHFNKNRVCSTIVDKEELFQGGRAIDCRKRAFNHAFQLLQDANIDGKLCKKHLDTPDEAFAKGMKNFTALSLEIDCVDKKTGDRMTISEADFFNPPDEYLDYCIAELMWYREYGYETENRVIPVKDDRKTWEILDYRMIDLFAPTYNSFAA